ncbi:MAG: hypothetical protein RBR28_01875 [Lentimicrobium sp.]|jgi:hypothetical protein|nr:hypothetical protein [Lentimicrobium sp.]
MKKYFLGLWLLFILQLSLQAQYYDVGQEAASIKWLTVETSDFEFIFPSTFSYQAGLAIKQFTTYAPRIKADWKVYPRKTAIVFHPFKASSNAYAAWTPRRIEILATPPQDMYAQPWMEQLALHEYRHMVQLARLDQNALRVLGWLFGQQAVPAAAGVFLPTWFIEGDAVMAETAHSKAGRGRVPDFALPLRAQLIEKNAYSYAKASLGSYRDFVSDPYTLGYHIIAATNLHHGLKPWEASMESISRLKRIRPFNYGLKRTTGSGKHQIYHQAMETLKGMWQPVSGKEEHFIDAKNPDEVYTTISSLSMLNDSVCAYLMSSLDEIPKFYTLNLKTRETKELFTPGYISGNWTDGSANKMVWAENRPHERWQMMSYNDLIIYDYVEASAHRLALRKKLYSPIIYKDGSKIAAIEYTAEGNPELTILSDHSSRNIRLPDTLHASMPAWGINEDEIFWIATSSKGKAIALTHLINEASLFITDFEFREISQLKWHHPHLYYLADCEGIMQLCRLNLDKRTEERLSASKFGVGNYVFYNDSVLYTSYTANGYQIAITADQPLQVNVKAGSWPLARALSDSLHIQHSPQPGSSEYFSINPYRKGKHLFNIHSWAPLYIDAGNERINPGISIMSQNILSTLFITAGYDYDLAELEGRYRLEATWKGWYPETSLQAATGKRSASYSDRRDQTWDLQWTETQIDLKFRIPFNFSSGSYSRGLSPRFELNQMHINYQGPKPDNIFEGNFTTFTYRIFAYIYQRMAHRDLAPRLGANLGLIFRHAPLGDASLGHIGGIETQFYLPGMGRNHSVSTYLAFQKNQPGDYIFSNVVGISRGYHHLAASKTLISGRLSYALPLLYPDLEIRDVLYLKRIRANIFADITAIETNSTYTTYNSLGIDLIFDGHAHNLPPQVNVGLRSIYRTNESDLMFQLLFSINLYDF